MSAAPRLISLPVDQENSFPIAGVITHVHTHICKGLQDVPHGCACIANNEGYIHLLIEEDMSEEIFLSNLIHEIIHIINKRKKSLVIELANGVNFRSLDEYIAVTAQEAYTTAVLIYKLADYKNKYFSESA